MQISGIKKGLRISPKPLLLIGSPDCSKERTFTTMVYFPDKNIHKIKKPFKTYRNPIIVAKEYDNMIKNGAYKSGADIARAFHISRVRVNQFLSLLKIQPKIIEYIEKLGDPLYSPVLTERMLRPYVNAPVSDQQNILNAFFTIER